MSGPDIFISYSREERPAARHFAESFADEGFSVWWDAVLRSGETFDEVIEKELRAAKAVVVLWSPRSVASRWVRAEATLADRANKLVPVIIEACDRPIIFELTHAADLADWTGDTSDSRWQTLVSDLRRLVERDKESRARHRRAEPAAKPQAGSAAPATPGSGEPQRSRSASRLRADQDELMQALDGSASRAAGASKPTPVEDEQTQFYKRSDEFRQHEGDKVHCLRRLDGVDAGNAASSSPRRASDRPHRAGRHHRPGRGVSRAHCLVELAADKLRVTDLNSTNGTYIDNKRIERSAILAVGSVLRVGNVSFEHEVRTRAEMQRPSDPARLRSRTRVRAKRGSRGRPDPALNCDRSGSALIRLRRLLVAGTRYRPWSGWPA